MMSLIYIEKRHIITRIMRYLPDISYQTAEAMVDEALLNSVALVRVLNSKKEASDLVQLFKRADPPVRIECFDAATNEVIFL